MKNIFIFCAVIFTTTSLFSSYTIRIAVYKNHTNLMRLIEKVPKSEYRKNIIIRKKNHLTYVTSISYEYEKEVHKALRAYKKVFPDAFVEKVEDKNIVLESKKPVLIRESTPKKTTFEKSVSEVSKPVVKSIIPALSAKELLENKTVYLCKLSSSKQSKKSIIELEFEDAYVLYRKLSKTASPLELPYVFDKNSVTLTVAEINFTYTILKKEDHFLLVQSYLNSKKGQKFRFYFDEDLAFEFAKNREN